MNPIQRRHFLKTTSATGIVALSGQAPSAFATAAANANSDGRILVVVEMAGGNDGLNTVVPLNDDRYRKARPTIAVSKPNAIAINDELAFHPVMTGMADLLNDGKLAVVQGVGYDNPNRSHFESMDIWHTCQRKTQNRIDGWLGRYLHRNGAESSSDPAALHLGEEKQPYAVMSRNVPVPSIRNLEQFRLNSREGSSFRDAIQELAAGSRGDQNDLLNFVQSSTDAAMSASARLESTAMHSKLSPNKTTSRLDKKLMTVARLISSGLQTSVYYVRIDGFDTHARQQGAHQSLMKQVSEAVSKFQKEITSRGFSDRVLTLCFSEFGRRVQENASKGTDHGTAGPMFLVGDHVRSGVIGKHPDLGDLVDGDLKHHTDFRQVYAAVLEQWLACDSNSILKGSYKPVDVIS
ncbi:MAG: DUF1501 domain-containing protein [Fuerstiella sp.]